ncbi:MAG: glutathione S-transferase family protein [Betaproteobacteria bacterium]|nr:MAG: glutathione S-transferase family protein [Betaproteobacteria bacterium]
MKLYYHPISSTCRPVLLFAAESGLPLELQLVDLFTGEQYQPPYEAINPNHLVPVLEDGDFRLTESSAILKYLADKSGSSLYPQELRQRARVNERMDWINTQLSRDLAYGTVYPQIFSFHKRRSDEAQQSTLQWGVERARGWMKVLDEHILGANAYLCGDALTIADYQASSFVALTEIVGTDLAAYPNVKQWLGRMKALKSWKQVNEVIDSYAATLKGQPMLAV